eukprot:IDg1483t1
MYKRTEAAPCQDSSATRTPLPAPTAMVSLKFAFALCALFAVTYATDVSTTERTTRLIARCPRCPRGKVCAGPPHLKICVKPMALNGQCGTDPFWVCGRGLRCVKNRCQRRFAVCPRCTHGFVCAGTRTHKRCVKPMVMNGRCGNDPFWVCGRGLRCVKNRCRRRFAICPRCRHGLVCAGTRTHKRCVKPMGVNGRCGTDPFWVCGRGLRCVRHKCRASFAYL